MALIQLFKNLLLRFPKHFILLFLFIFFQSLLSIMSIIAIAPITDYLLERNITNPSKVTLYVENLFSMFGFELSLLSVCIFFGIVMLFHGLAAVTTVHAILKIKYNLLIYLLTDTLGQFLGAKFLFFSQGNMGKFLNSFQQEVIKIGDTFLHIAKLFSNLLQLIILLVVPLVISPKLTIIFILATAFVSLPLWFLRKISYSLGRQTTITANKTTGLLHESLSAAKLILGFGRQKETVKRYSDTLKENSSAMVRWQTLEGGIGNLFLPLGIISVLIVFYTAYLDKVPLGEMALILFAFLRLMPVTALVLQGKASIEGFLPAYEQLEFLRNEAKKFEEVKGRIPFASFKKNFIFNKVSFNYPEKKKAINKIDLNIKKGQRVALIGNSGSGKTTVIDLMLGLYQENEGDIYLDGELLKNYDLNSYRKKVGYVPQDPQLLNTSVRENLLWSNSEASEDDIWQACRLSNAYEFIYKLPQKLETVLGDRGIRLSGGQRQRLSLARAIIRKPDILLLDEATSSLDAESENLIQKSINSLAGNMTIIIIAHRLSTIRNVDYIYVLENGKVIEEGTHKVLLQKGNGKLTQMIIDQNI